MTAVPLVFHPIYSQLSLPVRHRFPIEKYQGIKDRLLSLGVGEAQFSEPSPLNTLQLKSVYDPEYIEQLTTGTLDPKAMRRIGFPWSQQLIERTLTAAAGTVLCGELALQHGRALNLTGGYHHAFANFGSGFCMVNDLYLTALRMLQEPHIDRVLIFDCDVHQGDGTAKLAANNASIYTVSIHGEKNFPYRKQVSDLDFGLAKGTGDDEYLSTVEQALSMALTYSQADAVIYDAGVDIHVDDDLGHLDISTEGVYTRDKMVFDACDEHGLPVAAVIGGGYQRDIDALVDVHIQLFKAAGAY
ncbi:histone deacetylase [Glaciecola sp. XM2]|jgi:acetoin utilization deacetylase AcuC-like enzyme|uniref:histone deacetylase family protein n=1 Tax=Glaciecola sp. XM2 TaxID=1914931 RepID=UPI001BDEDDE3|nr:histone deacetylase [Glaciecola sp. XM2]MBT1452460.1 histone deacetylase [Glaciecola sp. XM2]